MDEAGNAIGRILRSILVHGLEVVCAKKNDDEIEGGVHLNPLGEAVCSFSSRLFRIVPIRPSPIEAILDDPGTATQFVELDFQ